MQGEELEAQADQLLETAAAQSQALTTDPQLGRLLIPPADPILEAEFVGEEE